MKTAQASPQDVEKDKILEERGADGSEAGVELEMAEGISYPFDPDKISISSQVVSLSYLVDQIKEGYINAPQIQRGENLWSIEQQSRLIESLMLKIPLPLFYVSVDREERWFIVDGLQRVSAIRNYIIDQKFKLTGLEFLRNECEGLLFRDLPTKYKKRIQTTQFQFATINATTPSGVQRTIFKRLNTGGLPLSAQEIRHALYYGNAAQFLEKLSKTAAFIQATDGKVNDTRMLARELILRSIAFLIRGVESYPRNNDMDAFLSETMQLMNAMPDMSQKNLKRFFYEMPNTYECKYTQFSEIKDRFILAMKRAYILFGTYAFRKSTSIKYRKTPINKALFDTLSVILAELSEEEFAVVLKKKNSLFEMLNKLFNKDHKFEYLISRDSLKCQSVLTRFRQVNDVFSSLIQ